MHCPKIVQRDKCQHVLVICSEIHEMSVHIKKKLLSLSKIDKTLKLLTLELSQYYRVLQLVLRLAGLCSQRLQPNRKHPVFVLASPNFALARPKELDN